MREGFFFLILCLPSISLAVLDESKYTRSESLHKDFKLLWRITDDKIYVGIEANAGGWVGLGISETGGMKGADIMYYEAGSNLLVDSFAEANAKPLVDVCQDWALGSASKEGGKIILEVSRALDTGDDQDWKIVNDAETALGHAIIAAWGDTPSMMYHGESKAKKRLFLFQDHPYDGLAALQTNPAIKTTELVHHAFDVPAGPSFYGYWCVNLKGAMGVSPDDDAARHVVGYEAILDPQSGKRVHHFRVFAYEGEDCTGTEGGLVLAWGKGGGPILMPKEAGLRVFGEAKDGGFRSFKFETHYDNPGQQAFKDSSGLRMYHTTVLRPYDIGMLIIGDSSVRLYGHTIPPGWSKFAFACDGLTAKFESEAVTVFQTDLHMHGLGERMAVRVKRAGQLLRSDAVEMYDYEQGGTAAPLSTGGGWELRRGDVFEVDCFYNTPRKAKFGFGSEDEMCMDFVRYYPRQRQLPIAGRCDVPAPGFEGPGRYLGERKLGHWQGSGRRFGVACDGSNQVAGAADDGKGRQTLGMAAGAAVMGAAAVVLWQRHQRQEAEKALKDEGFALVKKDDDDDGGEDGHGRDDDETNA